MRRKERKQGTKTSASEERKIPSNKAAVWNNTLLQSAASLGNWVAQRLLPTDRIWTPFAGVQI